MLTTPASRGHPSLRLSILPVAIQIAKPTSVFYAITNHGDKNRVGIVPEAIRF
jgi:hypothetical protein